ncbi:MAG: helix-turn-helix domain-containing protein [Candidatus Uhrbacteria bacterium]|nr:helix-turn-helix domain-containing protein [Candidatus Uhrbacteria bacterium]
MSVSKIKTVLIELGLSETESRVYLTMLELGSSSVQVIAKKAAVSRTAAYDIIATLQKKGLASTFEKGKKTLYTAEDPEKLDKYFKNRLDGMRGQLGALKQMVPELRVIQAGDRPRVRYFEGEEGILALFRDTQIVKAKELLEFANIDVVYSALDEKLLLALRSAEEYKKIPIKMLYTGELRNPNSKTAYRKLKDPVLDFEGDIWIYSNRIAFIKFLGDIEVVIVESQIFSNTMRALFMATWNSAGVK